MQRPQPKELVIRVLSETANMLIVSVASEDARAWIEREGATFGVLSHRGQEGYYLSVASSYDLREVVTWLNSYSSPR
jgi:hypothetical protein